MLILGVNAASHNTSAALLLDGRLVAFAEEERFNREKYTMAFPDQTIRYCLEEAGAKPEDVTLTAFAGQPRAEIFHSAVGAFRHAGRPWYRDWLRDQIVMTGVVKGFGQARRIRGRHAYDGPVEMIGHHQCHASSAFHCSPFEKAAILTIDAQGDGIATGLYRGEGTKIDVVKTWSFPQYSVGHFYDCVGEWLGFRPVRDAGKVMGLSSFGDPDAMREKFARFVHFEDDGHVRFDLDYLKNEKGRRSSKRFEQLFGPARRDDEEVTDSRFADVAAGAQAIVEENLLRLAKYAAERTGLENVGIAGGVGLNSVANGELAMTDIFENVWVQPAAYDGGLALGAALQAWHNRGGDRRFVMDHAYWGPDTVTAEVRDALRISKAHWREIEDPAAEAASLVAENLIVGWYQGRAEVGPRALGNRSILANPQNPDMKDIVNRDVKHREGFRPFAPSCILEEADRWFERGGPSPYMLKIWRVKPEGHTRLPSITHTDGTARLQTVEQSHNPMYHRMLTELGRMTGIPCVLNTSFNIRGEPIVNSPLDALKCYFSTGLDALVIDRFVLRKREPGVR